MTDRSGSTISNGIREELERSGLALPADFDDHTPLFESGLLDSTALFNLVLWVEEQTGRTIDPGSVDLELEWRDVGSIVRFIETGASSRRVSDSERPPEATSDGLTIQRFHPASKGAVAELQTHLWSPDVALNQHYFDWLYEANPHRTATPLVYLAYHQDDLVGMRGFWAAHWQIAGETVPVLVADDLVVRPAYRNRGVHQRMMEFAFADLADGEHAHAFNLSGSPVNVLASLSMGWKRAGRLDLMGTRRDGTGTHAKLRAIFKRTPLLWRCVGSRLLRSSRERKPFQRFDRRAGRSQTGRIVLSREPRPAAMAALVASRPRGHAIDPGRDQTYLAWRYQNPLRDYRFIYSGGEELDGYLSLSCPVPRALADGHTMIADFETKDDAVLRDLLAMAVELVDDLGIWTATLDPLELEALQDSGFSPIELERRAQGWPAVLVRPLARDAGWSVNGAVLTELRNWNLRPLFSMGA